MPAKARPVPIRIREGTRVIIAPVTAAAMNEAIVIGR